MQTERDIAAVRYNLGNRIRLLRKGQAVSQYVFARMTDVDRSYIIDVEKGRRNISINNLFKISRGLGISLSELFEDVDSAASIANRLALMEELLAKEEKAQKALPASTDQAPGPDDFADPDPDEPEYEV